MSFDIHGYCGRLKRALLAELGEGVCYIGLQGSYLRGEATQNSDIDIMVILNPLTIENMDAYRRIIEELGDYERSCGFICGLEDMRNWNPLEICQLKYTTKDVYGRLEDYLPAWSMEDERNYIKVSLNNLYHALCHGYIHGTEEHLRDSLVFHYKSAFFILQNIYYWENASSGEREAEFPLTKAELAARLKGKDRTVMEITLLLTMGGCVDFRTHFSALFDWCQWRIRSI